MVQDAAWLKRLATTLANDGDDADDLVQESWIAVWRRQPEGGRSLRPWLTKVVRDLAGMKRRSDRRRAAREAIADNTQAPAAPDELVEQMRLHRLLVDLVLELDEPYRSTVIARFVEGRTSVSIARSLGIPAGTVRKRLREALSRLRAGLDAKSGDRKQWAPAVLAFTKGGALVAKPTKLVLVLLALLLMSVATLVMFVLPHSPGPTAVGTGVPATTSRSTRSHAVPDEMPTARVIVAVTDAAGPVADAVVRYTPAEGEVVVTQTGGDGTASVDLAAGEWSIAASADGREPSAITLAVVAGRAAHVSLVLAMGGRTLTGTVTDASGGAIPGARIDAVRLDANTKPGRAVAVAFSDSGGHYKLSVGGGLLLVAASHLEYAPQTRYVDLGPTGATANFALVPGCVIEGVVRDVQ
ncbi:MAG: sigma-70 family RNA polymerase sigma factor, partial [Gemmatimonadaceae bacterium]|nr:sigma-70 family RNA polymerase sigma factor [Gemmatimonadaceae bacterium]